MTFKYRYKKQIITGAFIVLSLLIIGGIVIQRNFQKQETKKNNSMTIAKKKTKSSLVTEDDESDNKNEIYVDIKGEVNSPGTYLVNSKDRVKDVIAMAGGLTEKADTSVINLSKKLQDEMVIIIYSTYEVQNFKETKTKEQAAIDGCEYSEDYGLENDACIDNNKNTDSSNVESLINLNKATKEELMTLTGIGEAKANDIINYRNTNGGFKNIEEIKNVKGIGDSIFDKIKDRITI